MLERLDYVKIAPRRILDAGSGPPRDDKALLGRYRNAQLLALDSSLPMLSAGRSGFPWFRRRAKRLCADFEKIPLSPGAVDLVWSNMALHWGSDPLAAFREFERVLAPEGLLMFSTLGPDSLKELRAAAGASRVHAFVDMHDLGDMLVAAGFTAPVMDMELLTLTYRDGAGLLADLRASGQTSVRTDRPRGLAGRRFGKRLRDALAGDSRATFEVVYGHAWKPRAASESGTKTVRVFGRLS